MDGGLDCRIQIYFTTAVIHIRYSLFYSLLGIVVKGQVMMMVLDKPTSSDSNHYILSFLFWQFPLPPKGSFVCHICTMYSTSIFFFFFYNKPVVMNITIPLQFIKKLYQSILQYHEGTMDALWAQTNRPEH
jgi:hypothetical protein